MKKEEKPKSIRSFLIFLTGIVPLAALVWGGVEFSLKASSAKKIMETEEFVEAVDTFTKESMKRVSSDCVSSEAGSDCRADLSKQTVALAIMGENKTYCASVIRMASQSYCKFESNKFMAPDHNKPKNLLAIETLETITELCASNCQGFYIEEICRSIRATTRAEQCEVWPGLYRGATTQ